MTSRALVRVVVTAALLALTLYAVDVGAVGARLADLDLRWFAAALALTVVDHLISVERWRGFARGLGLELDRREALAELYLGSLVNQVLPGGVVGDAARAVRHGARTARNGEPRRGAAAGAVVLERATGQLALLVVVACAWLGWDALAGTPRPAVSWWAPLTLAALLLAAALALAPRWRGRLREALRGLRGHWAWQLALSFALVAIYFAAFVCAAHAAGAELEAGPALAVLPLCLLAMAVPLTVGGWGAREGAAAATFPLVGLTAEAGVAASVAYGVVVTIGALPGLVPLLRRRAA